MHSSTRWVLDLASLGLRSYKDGVYQQIAADDQSRVAVNTLFLVTFIESVIILVITVACFEILSFVRREIQTSMGRPSDSAKTQDTLESVLKSANRLRSVLYIGALWATIVLVNDFVSHARLSYVNSADAHFHQVLRVASPYLDAREQAEVESEFAQVRNRDDYVRVVSKLEDRCKVQGGNIPKFDPW